MFTAYRNFGGQRSLSLGLFCDTIISFFNEFRQQAGNYLSEIQRTISGEGIISKLINVSWEKGNIIEGALLKVHEF